jgi:hypothetical protein
MRMYKEMQNEIHFPTILRHILVAYINPKS